MMRRSINFFSAYPELEKFWVSSEYDKSEITKYDTRRLCRWVCEYGHEFEAYPARVANSKYKSKSNNHCKVCIGKVLVKGFNDLLSQAPQIASQLKDKSIDPSEIHKSSGKSYDWVCEKGHEYTKPVNRLFNGDGCGVCRGLIVLEGFNDLNHFFPSISKEITNLDPKSVTKYSGKRGDWKCSKCSHEWSTSISNRTFNGSGCPECILPNSSKAETRFTNSFSELFHEHEKLNLKWPSGRSIKCDFSGSIGDKKFILEYDGEYWHRDTGRQELDTIKTKILLDNGYIVIRYREKPLPLLDLNDPNLLQISGDYIKNDQQDFIEIREWIDDKLHSRD